MTRPQKVALLLLVAAVCVAAGVLAWSMTDPRGAHVAEVTSADAAEATVVSGAVTAQVREAAAAAVSAAYSYSSQTLAEDKAAARALMTPAMQDRYEQTMAGLATATRDRAHEVEADVVDVGVVTSFADRARVLVFVNRTTSGDDLKEPTVELDRVLVTLTRDRDGWKASDLDAL